MSTIVIYDSGVGGLSIHSEVLKQCPDIRYVFVSDNAAFPYGTKSEPELVQRVLEVTERIQASYTPDLMIVACNSASTVALPSLREAFAFPIVGVVPAIKPAAAASITKHIGLLATPGTISRAYTDELIELHAENCKVIKVGSSELVDMAEAKLRGQAVDLSLIKPILKPFLAEPRLDMVVLACTHFPLLADEIGKVLGAKVTKVHVIDSGQAIAKRVADLAIDFEPCKPSSVAVFTRELKQKKLRKALQQRGFDRFEQLPCA